MTRFHAIAILCVFWLLILAGCAKEAPPAIKLRPPAWQLMEPSKINPKLEPGADAVAELARCRVDVSDNGSRLTRLQTYVRQVTR